MSSIPLFALPLSPSSLSALTRAGYSTMEEVSSSNPERLAEDLNVPLHTAQSIFTAIQKPKPATPRLGQSAASLITSASSRRFVSSCAPLDRLLDGGLPCGHVLEISGPPGTRKESLAIDFVHEAVKAHQSVLFIDMQNMTSPAALWKALSRKPNRLVHYLSLHTAPEFFVFLHNLPAFLDGHPAVSLLVLNSIWFPFQHDSDMSPSTRSSLLTLVRQTLSRLCASRNLSVVVTNHMSTKLLNPDGSPANFDTGSRAVLVPQLGAAYLPVSRTHRVIVVPDSRTTGVLRLLSSPGNRPGSSEEAYELAGGKMHEMKS